MKLFTILTATVIALVSIQAPGQMSRPLTEHQTMLIDELFEEYPGIEKELIVHLARVRKISVHDKVREMREDRESKKQFESLPRAQRQKYLQMYEDGIDYIKVVQVSPDPTTPLRAYPHNTQPIPPDGQLNVTIRYVLSSTPEARIGYWPKKDGKVSANWPGFWVFTEGCGEFTKHSSFTRPSLVDEIDARIIGATFTNILATTTYRPSVPWKSE